MDLDLDQLEALARDAAVKRAEAARFFDVSHERYRENRKATTREDIAATNEAYGKSIDAYVEANRAACAAEKVARDAALDALPALITRLRAAEARADAADAQGYARAMGEVEAHAWQQSEDAGANDWHPHAAGQQHAWDECWTWARERAAAAEKEREG